MDHVCKTDLVVNNLTEVFNKMIIDVRSKPIKPMLEGLRSKLMVKYQGIREKTENCRWKITPHYMEKLEESKKWAKYCEADIWEVSSGENTYCVDLDKQSCSCKRRGMFGSP
jgi:hypothetical protein